MKVHVGAPCREDKTNASRRHSTGGFAQWPTAEMLPFELAKKPIKPPGVPLETDRFDDPVVASPENELISNKLEVLEERQGPEKQWEKVTKYTVYTARGFGTVVPNIGIGVYRVELQKHYVDKPMA